ncbi:MAG: cell envelope protein SmpA [Robiginitomaculum sp.]|nr:MAG: cell envelope protein SmpA [Robiginitomaculum sp.]
MNNSIKALLLGTSLCVSMSACTPITRSHGFIAAKESPGDVESGIDSKTTVLAKYGSPSTTGVFEKDTWYYLSEFRQQLGFLQPKTQTRSITAIRFSDEGIVDNVDTYTLEDGKFVSLVGRSTPTRGKELSVLEQLVGTVGRVPGGNLGAENLPGGAGGPRRDQ